MKASLRNIVLGAPAFEGYVKIALAPEEAEPVYLEIAGQLKEISTCQSLLCIQPFIIGVWLDSDTLPASFRASPNCRIILPGGAADNSVLQQKAEVVMDLKLTDCMEEEGGTLLLLELKAAHLHQMAYWKQLLAFHRYYKKPDLSLARFQCFVASYSYPRTIRIVSFREGAYYNIFPMDLLTYLPGPDSYMLGLGLRNVTLERIVRTGRVVVSEVPVQYRDIIYSLGRHHSGHPPAVGSLPFKVLTTADFGFFVPEWATSYREIRILETRKLGSHRLLWGTVSSGRQLAPAGNSLATVHFLHWLYRRRRGSPYREA